MFVSPNQNLSLFILSISLSRSLYLYNSLSPSDIGFKPDIGSSFSERRGGEVSYRQATPRKFFVPAIVTMLIFVEVGPISVCECKLGELTHNSSQEVFNSERHLKTNKMKQKVLWERDHIFKKKKKKSVVPFLKIVTLSCSYKLKN